MTWGPGLKVKTVVEGSERVDIKNPREKRDTHVYIYVYVYIYILFFLKMSFLISGKMMLCVVVYLSV